MRSPEALAEQFVTLADDGAGGGRRVQLSVPGSRPVRLRSHGNPALVRDEVAAVRRAVAAAIRAGRAGDPSGGQATGPSRADD